MKTTEETGNLPKWIGAAHAYSKAYKILHALAKNAPHKHHVMIPSSNSRRSNSFYVCTDIMEELIDALNKGDEERIKWHNLAYSHLL